MHAIARLSTLFVLAGLVGLAAATPGAAQTQGPIRITADLHCDPIPNALPYAGKADLVALWIDNVNWVLDQAEPLGVEIAFLSSGTFMEFVVQDGPSGDGAALLRRLYGNGAQIGSHSHAEYRAAAFDWPSFPGTPPPPLSDSIRSWQDNVDWVDQAILTAWSGSPPEPIERINSVRGAHLPPDESDFHLLMESFGFPFRQPGPEEDYYGWFHHHIWNPYRPSASNPMGEDLEAPFVQMTQGAVIGNASPHHGVFQDMRAAAVKRQFLQLYVNWRYRDRMGLPEKVWCWGWGSHASDFDPTDSNRADLVEVIQWLGSRFAGRVEPTGSTAMVWDTHRGVGEAYLAWEAAHPGESSFSFDSLTVDWDEYPYLRAVAEEMDEFEWSADLSLAPGVEGYLLHHGPLDAVLLWRPSGSGTTVVDLSGLVGPLVRVVGLETGILLGTDPSGVEVGAEPLLVTEDAAVLSVIGTPRLGEPITFELTGRPDLRARIAASRAPRDVVKPYYGRLLIDPRAGLRLIGTGWTSSGGTFRITRTIPNRPELVGRTFYLQGAVHPFDGASTKLTVNSVVLTVEG